MIGPYLEIAQLSGTMLSAMFSYFDWFYVAKSADGIEDSVEVKEPIQSDLETPLKLFGEDALLDWPGAMDPVIHQRDQFMARNLYLTATSNTCKMNNCIWYCRSWEWGSRVYPGCSR